MTLAPFPLSAAWRKAGAVMAAMEPDPKTAMDILTKLEQNQTHAGPGMYFLLGYLHEEGLGTPQDMARCV